MAPRALLPHQVLPASVYERHRDAIRQRIFAEKAQRRIALGEGLSFQFESASTALYQVQEIVRVEGLSKPAEILDELRTASELLTAPVGLACTLMLHGSNHDELRALQAAVASAYLVDADGRRVYAHAVGPQVPLAAVHFLRFPIRSRPRALGIEGPAAHEVALAPVVGRTLERDLCPREGKTLLALLGEPEAGRARSA